MKYKIRGNNGIKFMPEYEKENQNLELFEKLRNREKAVAELEDYIKTLKTGIGADSAYIEELKHEISKLKERHKSLIKDLKSKDKIIDRLENEVKELSESPEFSKMFTIKHKEILHKLKSYDSVKKQNEAFKDAIAKLTRKLNNKRD